MCGEWVYRLHDKNSSKPHYNVETTRFCFSSRVGVVLDDIEDLMLTRFRVYNVTQSRIHMSSNVMAPGRGWTATSAASGAMENYLASVEYTRIADLCYTNLLKKR
jgi:hypothetical protein